MRRRIVILIVIFAVSVVTVAWYRYSLQAAAIQRSQEFERESFAILNATKTQEDIQAAVGDLGYVFHLSNGKWVAIRYRDSHEWPIASSAVALDSSGNWWVSREHFCGRFRAFGRKHQAAGDLKELIATFPLLTQLAQAPSLDTAHAALTRLGFHAPADK